MSGPSWGSYQSPENVSSSKFLWSNIRETNEAVLRLTSLPHRPGAGLYPEVAVFLPSTASNTRTYNMEFDHLDDDTDDYNGLQFQFGTLGAPVRWFYLEQLPALDAAALAHIKLAVLLCPIVISDALRSVIQTRLATDNRTLVWSYSAGLLTSTTSGDFNLSRAAEVSGLPIHGHGSAAPIRTRLLAAPQFPRAPQWTAPLLASEPLAFRQWEGVANGGPSGVPDYVTRFMRPNTTSPWYEVREEPGVVVLGRFASEHSKSNGRVSVAWRDLGDHRAIYSCHSWLPRLAWRAIALAAGVHLYVDGGGAAPHPVPCQNASLCPQCMRTPTYTCLGFGDVAEATGPALMVHAGPTLMRAGDKARRVHLPCAATSVRDAFNGSLVCRGCDSFRTRPMEAGEVSLFAVDIACPK